LWGVFGGCNGLSEVEFSDKLETLEKLAFANCRSLRRMAVPLKEEMISDHALRDCPELVTVDLVGSIRKTVSSLHLECWRDDMKDKIDRFNQVLPHFFPDDKTIAIKDWIQSVTRQNGTLQS
jgi:hypothetical protein